ncbi:hypothetical protein E2R51_16890 [Jeotgalibacillus sp. S-D1]|uniref:hypothetical protein n=1 Tax=Jeotgalibacillus sp. S-D1 TaxID=2552189 RepID=UPI001059A2F2|nr:hypothetical protein [Jeotgalibacillus sp. S-D1]TDL30667.1 hypothetical protein E2R51_16890 [Jeotgalibacillus sp. S-D1]
MKKKIFIVFLSIVILSVIVYGSINVRLSQVKSNVKEHNPEITKVESINNLGGWGEWFLDYSLVVVVDGERYRVWTNGNGELTDKLSLE